MTKPAILAIDQGTTNTKVILVDQAGNVVARASVPVLQTYPAPGWVEQDAVAIWESVKAAIDACLSIASDHRPVAVAISNQRETVTMWHRTRGSFGAPAIGWQCRRTNDFCESLRLSDAGPTIVKSTGLGLDPLFSASKMRWLFDNYSLAESLAAQRELCFGTIDSWLLWNLTGGEEHRCDVTNASRTQLFNIHQLSWDVDLTTLFGVPISALPLVSPTAAVFGTTKSVGRLSAGLPIACLAGDSHAALFGHLGFQPGVIKATYGTGSSLMTMTTNPVSSAHGLSTTIAWQLDGEPVVYALEGNIAVSGAAIKWLGEFLGFADPVAEVARLAANSPRAAGLYIVPALVGLGAPHWDSAVRGLITGLGFETNSAHLARAALEAIAYQIRDVFEAMQRDIGVQFTTLSADGGASNNAQLMQFQADLLGCQVQAEDSADLSALGAAYLAGLAVGFWDSKSALEQLARTHREFSPEMAEAERQTLCDGWHQALLKTRFGSKLVP